MNLSIIEILRKVKIKNMDYDEKCRNCVFFPCLRPTCNIGNKEGCDNFKSIIQKELEEIDKKLE